LVPEEGAFVVQALLEGEWRELYVFERHVQQLADYEVSNWYLANHPQSQFVTGIVAARAEPGLRHALRNARYAIHHRDGRTERRTLASVEEIRRVLEDRMRIPLPDHPALDARLGKMLREAR
ncbi:MAG TPA: arylamine N-acetyltransferase, partial [Usitatibacter sp.]|nr:arylamine N-acetyltransferase [Usitatibacter sp.]